MKQNIINGAILELLYEIICELLNEGVNNPVLEKFANEYKSKKGV